MTQFDVGTLRWARVRGGELSRMDQLQLLTQAVVLQLKILPVQVRSTLGLGRKGLARLDFNKLRIPDSRVARDADALCKEVSPPHLINHCHRTYLWGALSRHPRINFKREMTAFLHTEVDGRPRSRSHFLYHKLNFGRLIMKAPFKELTSRVKNITRSK